MTGEDAFTYLQSQFSNDLKRNIERPSTYGLFLNRKGKVQADAFVLRRGEEDFLVVSYFAESAVLKEIVEANLIADEVEMEDVSQDYKLVTLWGDETLLTAYLPEAGTFRDLEDALVFRGRRMNAPHVEALVSADECWPDDDAIDSGEGCDGIAALNSLNEARIRDGVPASPFDIGPDDLPQEAGDLATSAVSYTKGCYLGQEVMARLHAMGKAQRALYRVSFVDSAQSGTPIFAGEKQVGELRSQVPVDGEKFLGLAMLKRRYVSPETEFCLGEPGGPSIKIEGETGA
ncbi:MAG: YgfZ/GcvT domain-containing protein [Puniceicoccales bacterium]